MSAVLAPLWRAARWRRQAIVCAAGLPLAALAAALAWRLATPVAVGFTLLLALLATATVAWLGARRIDRRWLVRRLDGHRDLEDSADLLLADPATLGPLQRLQHARVSQRLAATAHDVREPWPRRRLLAVALPALALAAMALAWPAAPPPRLAAAARDLPTRGDDSAPTLRSAVLHAAPPAYTGQPAGVLPTLDARLAQGSTLRWTLRFATPPQRVALRMHDGRVLALSRAGTDWQAQMTLDRSMLYRIVVDGQPLDHALHRLEAVPDRPPQVRVLEPDSSLVQWTPSPRGWTLRFEASDDYGVAADAQLRLTLAQGSGENITFRAQTLALTGSGAATARGFAVTLQPAALGMQPGSDLVVQLAVHDTRQPRAQEARSASVILRWPPPEQVLASELDGSVKQTLPAYFRSQRQIIIDAEALLKRRSSLAAADYLQRADAIGVDQRLLRLRYGQFLGEESEGAPQAPAPADALPVSDALPVADDLPTADAPQPPPPAPAARHAADDDHAAEGAAALDDHAHGQAERTPTFGNAGDVVAEFGHTHDHAEAATLLDPQTRATLKAALDQMWQAEGELRQGRPERALPFAYKALGYIKQVQQAERIYLARVGPQLPPIDPARRMGGQRDGIGDRVLAPAPRTPPDPQALALWQALGEHGEHDPAGLLDAVGHWLAGQDGQDGHDADMLDLAAALETLRATPACTTCRQRLRALLWPLLQRPAAAPLPRAPAGAGGQRYLDALQREEAR